MIKFQDRTVGAPHLIFRTLINSNQIIDILRREILSLIELI